MPCMASMRSSSALAPRKGRPCPNHRHAFVHRFPGVGGRGRSRRSGFGLIARHTGVGLGLQRRAARQGGEQQRVDSRAARGSMKSCGPGVVQIQLRRGRAAGLAPRQAGGGFIARPGSAFLTRRQVSVPCGRATTLAGERDAAWTPVTLTTANPRHTGRADAGQHRPWRDCRWATQTGSDQPAAGQPMQNTIEAEHHQQPV